MTYGQSLTFTCNYGFALKDTFAPPHPQACVRTQFVKCMLHEHAVALLPALPVDHCSPAPCGRYYYPDNAISNQGFREGVHNDIITATCNSGYRAYLPSLQWSNCATSRTFQVTCDDCSWKDGGFTCQKVRIYLAPNLETSALKQFLTCNVCAGDMQRPIDSKWRHKHKFEHITTIRRALDDDVQ